MSSVPGDNYTPEQPGPTGGGFSDIMGGFLARVGDSALDLGTDYLSTRIERGTETKQASIVGQAAPVSAPDNGYRPNTFDGEIPGTVQIAGLTLHKTSLYVAGAALGAVVLLKLLK